jgi:hypothetical protein
MPEPQSGVLTTSPQPPSKTISTISYMSRFVKRKMKKIDENIFIVKKTLELR